MCTLFRALLNRWCHSSNFRWFFNFVAESWIRAVQKHDGQVFKYGKSAYLKLIFQKAQSKNHLTSTLRRNSPIIHSEFHSQKQPASANISKKNLFNAKYSRVPNKRTSHLLDNEKKPTNLVYFFSLNNKLKSPMYTHAHLWFPPPCFMK